MKDFIKGFENEYFQTEQQTNRIQNTKNNNRLAVEIVRNLE